MKKLFITIVICFTIFSCTKEVDKTQTCGWVFNKYYQTSASVTTYWLWLANDTLSNAAGNRYVIEVNKPCFDTMLMGQPYPQQYCY